jgi:hypothetical protein
VPDHSEALRQAEHLFQSLLDYCTRRSRNSVVPANVEVKMVPRDLLDKCDHWPGHFPISCVPVAPEARVSND